MTLLTMILVGSRLYSVLLEGLGDSASGGVAWRRLWVLGAERIRASTALRPPYSTRNGLCTPSGTSSCHKTWSKATATRSSPNRPSARFWAKTCSDCREWMSKRRARGLPQLRRRRQGRLACRRGAFLLPSLILRLAYTCAWIVDLCHTMMVACTLHDGERPLY